MNNNQYPYFAIRISGPRDNIFCLRKVVSDGATNPVDCIAYRSEQEAREAADNMELEIKKIGNCYQIL